MLLKSRKRDLNNCRYFRAGKAFSVNARERKIVLKLILDQILTDEFVDQPRKRNTKQDNETRDICLELGNLQLLYGLSLLEGHSVFICTPGKKLKK